MLTPEVIRDLPYQEIIRHIEADPRAMGRLGDNFWISLIRRDRPDLGNLRDVLPEFNRRWGTNFASWMEVYNALDTVNRPPGTLVVPNIDADDWRFLQEEHLFFRDAEEEATQIIWNPRTATGVVSYRNPGYANRAYQELSEGGFSVILIPGVPDPLDFWEGSEGRYFET